MNKHFGCCVDCKSVTTTNKIDDEFVCASCSNGRYFDKLRNGDIIELKLDMNKIKRSTYLHILSLIQRDSELP